jgi:deoxyribodipyrimidine photolyase-related protein
MRAFWILGDQLQHDHPALEAAGRDDLLLFIESRARGAHLRYHTHKLVLIYSAMRHYAAALQAAGRTVAYHRLEDGGESYADALEAMVRRHRITTLVVMRPSEWAMREALPKLARRVGVTLEVLPSNQFLVPDEAFAKWAGKRKHLLMADHYQTQRKRLGILLDAEGKPEGGRWSFDTENRETYAQFAKAAPEIPPLPRESSDEATEAVIAAVERFFPGHPGNPRTFWLPVTRKRALHWLDDFIQKRLAQFGPYEDTMVEGEPVLFHSVLTPMLNIGLLRPRECVDRAVEAWKQGRAPLASVEGFVRQIIGWREFINGVYNLEGPEYAEVNALQARRPLPAWMWEGQPPLRCVAECVQQARATGYNHHIQRLMVLGNFFLLGGYEPRAVVRWYMEHYVDAYDWVMLPNVLGMVLYADGGRFSTKPYAAGSGYIGRMGNYCARCQFDPKQKTGPRACPFNYLYWDFFARHRARFAANPRVGMMVRTLDKKPPSEQQAIRESADAFLEGA